MQILTLRSHEVAFLQAAQRQGFDNLPESSIEQLSLEATAVLEELKNPGTSVVTDIIDWAAEVKLRKV